MCTSETDVYFMTPYVNSSTGFTLLLISNNIIIMDIIKVLQYINDNPGSNSNEIASELRVNKNDVSVRLYKLKYNSNMIRRTNDKKPYTYEITEFGTRYLKYKKENPGKKKQWHGLIPENYR